ncbi:MAG: nucleotidyltransferase domain-containing protein [Anaerolineales bacterium]
MSKRFKEIEQICKKYQVKAMYVFGSRGTELFRVIHDDTISLSSSQSDLDIGVLTHSSFSIDDKVNLTLEFENLFSNAQVDLFVLQDIDAFLAANIIRGERVYAQDEYLADEYELFVLRRAGDLAELERERLAMILQEK